MGLSLRSVIRGLQELKQSLFLSNIHRNHAAVPGVKKVILSLFRGIVDDVVAFFSCPICSSYIHKLYGNEFIIDSCAFLY